LYPCFGTSVYIADISTKGQYTYVVGYDSATNYAKFSIFDMTTPRNPVTKSTVTIGTDLKLSGMAIDEDYGYFFSALGAKFYIYDLLYKIFIIINLATPLRVSLTVICLDTLNCNISPAAGVPPNVKLTSLDICISF
jgi:hypothetical protein